MNIKRIFSNIVYLYQSNSTVFPKPNLVRVSSIGWGRFYPLKLRFNGN